MPTLRLGLGKTEWGGKEKLKYVGSAYVSVTLLLHSSSFVCRPLLSLAIIDIICYRCGLCTPFSNRVPKQRTALALLMLCINAADTLHQSCQCSPLTLPMQSIGSVNADWQRQCRARQHWCRASGTPMQSIGSANAEHGLSLPLVPS